MPTAEMKRQQHHQPPAAASPPGPPKTVVAGTMPPRIVGLGIPCTYRWNDPSAGKVETCRRIARCRICRQCTDGAGGHCTGHLGLMDHIQTEAPQR